MKHQEKKENQFTRAYEEGRAEPSIPTLIKIADVFGYSGLDDFLKLRINDGKLDKIQKAYLKADQRDRRTVEIILGLIKTKN